MEGTLIFADSYTFYKILSDIPRLCIINSRSRDTSGRHQSPTPH